MAGRFLVCVNLKGIGMDNQLLEQILAEQRKTNALLTLLIEHMSDDIDEEDKPTPFASLSQRAD